ncbi:MAG: putative selenate reductase subunit YgfK, partial [bacterium]|nr:putative selenate reductase subunit YgfK [bacterium]
MSDRMTPIPFAELMNWIITEREKYGTVFALNHAYQASIDTPLTIFGEFLETPFGPAAGPNTQLAQNIIASYYAGARFFELKTVQTLDGEDLPVSKPCILAEDECYNVEWSTELRVGDAFNEYVKAWYALKLISQGWGLGDPDGFIFNMSVGYDFAGIASEKIDSFIEGLKDARNTPIWKECEAWARENWKRINPYMVHNCQPEHDCCSCDGCDDDDCEECEEVPEATPEEIDEFFESIPSNICRSITLSTLHGCPPQEIEKIASYLIDTKHLHTFVKCNPTLLGYEFARRTLDEMGYDYIVFDDNHFLTDLQYKDAVPMFRRLLKLAADNNVTFGVKLTNTFPVDITRNELPGNEMYMSGRSLYPLTTELARRLTTEFDGQLRISYSGGVDHFNIKNLFDAGIWPITMATTLLKPGGYQRFTQMAEDIIDPSSFCFEFAPWKGVSVSKITRIAHDARTHMGHVKAIKPAPKRKIEGVSPRFDCFIAPCSHGCPINQDIPEYISLVGQEKYAEALSLIMRKNPLPFITGTICSHRCQEKCTRNFYEEAVRIRNAKLLAAREGFGEVLEELKPKAEVKDKKAAVIGGGPGGMAAAFFLARRGVKTVLFEKRKELGGIVRWVIPEFRIEN